MIENKHFETKEDMFKYIKENKDTLIAQKKFEMKRADAFSYSPTFSFNKESTEKALSNPADLLKLDKLNIKTVINTTGLLDSHKDVHIHGLWKKTLSENKQRYLLQEHKMKFDHIISDKVKCYTENISWKELGVSFKGETEALIFDSDIEKSRNPYMFEQYANGYVKNHSVGMVYVKLFLCINSKENYLAEEKDNWDKYIGYVVNNKEAEEIGYFWAVTEAKLIEGSAVPMGSNWVTPTLDITESKIEPDITTQKQNNEPLSNTRNRLIEISKKLN